MRGRGSVEPDQSKLMGAIFMANSSTRKECFELSTFGLPSSHEKFVLRIKAGAFLFLFDHEERKLYGVFEATSDGAMNIVPDAYFSSGRSFPAQVKFRIVWKCKPLREAHFRDAIRENYYQPNKFRFGLSYEQVVKLVELFDATKVHSGSQLIPYKPQMYDNEPTSHRSQSRQHGNSYAEEFTGLQPLEAEMDDKYSPAHYQMNGKVSEQSAASQRRLQQASFLSDQEETASLASKDSIILVKRNIVSQEELQLSYQPLCGSLVATSRTVGMLQGNYFGSCYGIPTSIHSLPSSATQSVETDSDWKLERYKRHKGYDRSHPPESCYGQQASYLSSPYYSGGLFSGLKTQEYPSFSGYSPILSVGSSKHRILQNNASLPCAEFSDFDASGTNTSRAILPISQGTGSTLLREASACTSFVDPSSRHVSYPSTDHNKYFYSYDDLKPNLSTQRCNSSPENMIISSDCKQRVSVFSRLSENPKALKRKTESPEQPAPASPSLDELRDLLSRRQNELHKVKNTARQPCSKNSSKPADSVDEVDDSKAGSAGDASAMLNIKLEQDLYQPQFRINFKRRSQVQHLQRGSSETINEVPKRRKLIRPPYPSEDRAADNKEQQQTEGSCNKNGVVCTDTEVRDQNLKVLPGARISEMTDNEHHQDKSTDNAGEQQGQVLSNMTDATCVVEETGDETFQVLQEARVTAETTDNDHCEDSSTDNAGSKQGQAWSNMTDVACEDNETRNHNLQVLQESGVVSATTDFENPEGAPQESDGNNAQWRMQETDSNTQGLIKECDRNAQCLEQVSVGKGRDEMEDEGNRHGEVHPVAPGGIMISSDSQHGSLSTDGNGRLSKSETPQNHTETSERMVIDLNTAAVGENEGVELSGEDDNHSYSRDAAVCLAGEGRLQQPSNALKVWEAMEASAEP